jgi:tetratricopeptide (TPR) repeat protein
MRFTLPSLFLIPAFLACVATATAADSWTEARSPHFVVVSNAGEKRARDVAWQLEQIRGAIEKGWPWARVQLNRPLVAIAVKDEASMKAIAPKYWEKGSDIHPASIFGSGPDRHYITLRADVQAEDREGVNPYNQAYWSYAALTLESSFDHGLPLWLTTGLGAVLSNTIVRETEIQFGRPLPWYVRELQQPGGHLRLRELIAVDRESSDYTSQLGRARYVAQCWGLMHYLLFGMHDDHARAQGDTQLTKLLLEGTPSAAALEQSFGNLDALDTAYRRYVQQGLFKYSRLQVDTAVLSKNFPTRTMSPAEAAVVRAGFFVVTGRAEEARREVSDARSADATLAGSYEIEGELRDRERDAEGARSAYSKAAELRSSNFYTYYRLATLASRPNMDPATLTTIQDWLTRALALNDGYGPACAFLATVLVNKPDDSIAMARRAVILEPGSFSHRMVLARVYDRVKRTDDARKAALSAKEFARTDAERDAVSAFLDALGRRPGV